MIWQPAPIPPNGLLLKMPYRFNRSHQFHVRNRSCALRDSIILQALQKEPAMNGTSGFGEVRSSTSRSSTNRFLDEQRHQFGTGSDNHFHAPSLRLRKNITSSMHRKRYPCRAVEKRVCV